MASEICVICQSTPVRTYFLVRQGVMRRTVHLCREHGEPFEMAIKLSGTRTRDRGERMDVSQLKKSKAMIAREMGATTEGLDGSAALAPRTGKEA